MKNKSLIISFFVSSILLLSVVLCVNFYIDPLWISSHKNKYNSSQTPFDERLTKSIALKYNNYSTFDTLLLGSSRGTYLNVNKFTDLKVFNYAFSAGHIQEFPKYINFARKENPNIKNIILVLDFWHRNKANKNYLKKREPFSKLQNNKLFFFLKNYSLYSVLKKSNDNYKKSFSKSCSFRCYDRNFVANMDILTSAQTENNVKKWYAKKQKQKQTQTQTQTQKQKQNKYKQNLLNIRNMNMNMIVYTTPLSKIHLDKIMNSPDSKKQYYQWINDTVSVFGKVYFFTMPNYYSKNYHSLSKDGSHYYPNALESITSIIENKKDINTFGLILTKENLKDKIKEIKDSYK